jgi:hypothetical protein
VKAFVSQRNLRLPLCGVAVLEEKKVPLTNDQPVVPDSAPGLTIVIG